MSMHSVQKGSSTLFATPLTGKYAGRCVQMRRKHVPFVGYGHKIEAKLTPDAGRPNLHVGVIYLFNEKYGFAEVDARCLRDVHRLLGDAFVLVDPGILVASKKVFIPKLAQRMAGIRMGRDEHGDDLIAWIICTRKGTKRLRDRLPSYKRRTHPGVPDEAA